MIVIKSNKVAGTLRMVSFLALTVFMFTGFNASNAQAFPGFLEGPISDVDLVNRTVRINGVLAHVPGTTPISSPTATGLSLEDISLAVGGDLDGRSTGFEGGTCLCATEVAADGAVTVTDFVAEPSENVLIATVTAHSCSTSDCSGPGDVLEIGGTPMAKNLDPRIPSDPPSDAGFEINLQNLDGGPSPSLVGNQAGGEGYYGDDEKLHYYVLEIVGGVPASSDAQIAVTRARCRNKNGGAQYRVEGTTSNPGGATHGGPVDLLVNGTTLMGTSVQDPLDPTAAFATWAIREEINGVACESGTAVFTPAGGTPVQTTFDPDIR